MSQHYNKYWFLVLLFGACLLTACAQTPVKKVEIFWPLPPDPPRIGYVSSFSEPKDMNRTKSFLKNHRLYIRRGHRAPHCPALRRLIGWKRNGVRHGRRTQVVHVFDFAEKNYRQVFKLKNGRLRSAHQHRHRLLASGEEMLYVTESEAESDLGARTPREIDPEIGKEGEFQGVRHRNQSRFAHPLCGGYRRA